MTTTEDALAYAKEVYAACATCGFAGVSVATLKALIDAGDHDVRDLSPTKLTEAAQRAHLEAADWARGR